MSMMHMTRVVFLMSLFTVNEAFNLRYREQAKLTLLQERSVHEDEKPGIIPDPTCKKGVMSPDMKVCCTDECGSCGNHKLCDDPGQFHELTGKLADNCCKDRIAKKKVSCDKDHAPCVLSSSYKETIDKYVITRPKRHATDDCNKAIPVARSNHALAIEKGEFLTKLYLHGKTVYNEAMDIAIKVNGLCVKKTKQSKALVDDYVAKIAEASDADKEVDPLTGASKVDQLKDARDNEKAEVEFYAMIIDNAEKVEELAQQGIRNVKAFKTELEKVRDVEKHLVKLNALIDDANKVYGDAELLWKQWEDSSKDYNCPAPPGVVHAKSQCESGNTKYSPKCHVVCQHGYDGNGTQNALRCNRQGKFGKQLYGEWMGMATCAGRVCGMPPPIAKAKTVIKQIRYPHMADYVCYEGHSSNRQPDGPQVFTIPCGPEGNFEQNTSHVCKAITCGRAPQEKNTHEVKEENFYTDITTYKCLEGHTVDGTPGGLKSYTRTCQATGKRTEGQGCYPVRCGPPPSFDHASLAHPTKEEQYYGHELDINCDLGYTIDSHQRPSGADFFTVVCQADGQFAVKFTDGEGALPKCRPVSAGTAPLVSHGNFNPREMFYGESVQVTADLGYSSTGHPTEGVSFLLSVTPQGKYAGLEKFIPVVCGKPPAVDKSVVVFDGKASYGDVLSYDCKDGYSVDKTSLEASASFDIECNADSSFSAVPGLGSCLNIDDCAEHTCGPHGDCVDHLMNYTCNCQAGYEQRWDNKTDELLCGNIDDCGPEACGVGTCKDLLQGYECDCPEGYEEIDETNEETGKVDHTCKAVECGLPPTVDACATIPAEAQNEKAYFMDTVSYQCNEGYTLDGSATGDHHFDIECKSNRDFTEAKECKPIKCDHVQEVAHATPTRNAATFNQTVRYDCDEGHTVDGTAGGDHGFTVTCQVTGEFGEVQACKPVSCGEPDSVANANRPSGRLVYKETITYSCFEGFSIDGQASGEKEFSAECHEDGKLDNLKQCVPVICGKPSMINVLYASTKDEGVIRYPEFTEIICRDGYTSGGDPGAASSFQVKCLSNGDFEKVDERECQPVKCGAPPAMANASLSKIQTPEPAKPGLTRTAWWGLGEVLNKVPDLNRKRPKSTVVVPNINYPQAREGANMDVGAKENFAFRFDGALIISEAGDYKFKLFSDDGSLLYINGDKIIDHDGPHGMTAKDSSTINLSAGPHSLKLEYAQRGGGTGVVLKWQGPDSDGDWQVVPESAFKTKGGNLNYEEKAIYKCHDGFTTGGEYDAPTEYKVECLPSGELSFPSLDMQCRNVDDCEQHTCGKKGTCIDLVGPAPAYTCDCEHGYEIQTKDNGEKHCGNIDDCQGKDCGVGVCQDLIGDYTCQCPTGYYIGFNPHKTCVPVRCSDDTPSIDDGRLLSHHSGAVDFPTTLRYRCDVGYSIDGSVAESKRKFQAQCKSDGQLVGMGSCQKITCGSPHVIPYTRLLVPSSRTSSVEYDDKAKYECITGYTISGDVDGPTNFEVKCQDSGVLTDPETCEPVKCGPAPRVANSRPGISGDVRFGQHLVYRCDLGHTLDGTVGGTAEFDRECKSDGSFSHISYQCKPISPGNAPTMGNADLKEYDGRAVTSLPVRVYYPKGVEYRCKPGYSTNGASSGPTKTTARVNSIGTYTPALPSQCKLIAFTIRGRLKNARNGAYLSGVRVSIVGSSISASATWGFFTLRNVPPGSVKLRYEKSGYISTEQTISVNGNIYSGGVASISMSPAMAPDQWRAVVEWGRRPSDLDTHVRWGWSRVFWARRYVNSLGMRGRLEQDKTAGYGPETVYLSGVGNCRWGSYYCDVKYYIYDYTRSGSMLRNGVKVTLYNGNRVAGSWKISECASRVTSRGNWWPVFTIDGRNNRLKWSCNNRLLFADLSEPEDVNATKDLGVNATKGLRIRRIAE